MNIKYIIYIFNKFLICANLIGWIYLELIKHIFSNILHICNFDPSKNKLSIYLQKYILKNMFYMCNFWQIKYIFVQKNLFLTNVQQIVHKY